MSLKMRTSSIAMTSFTTPATPSIPHQNLKINSSEEPWPNNSTWSPVRSSDLGLSCFTMIFGAISNLTALGILARVKVHHHSKAPFLLLTVSLLVTDLGGHVITGAFALHLHINQQYKTKTVNPTKEFCQIFGASMVFFGLCPLLLGCAMAVERYVAITRPFFHAAQITSAHALRSVLLLCTVALVPAVLPYFTVGTYTTQAPGTWCFLHVHRPPSTADTNLTLAFSCLGLAALALSLLCNILSGLALLKARTKCRNSQNTESISRCSRRASSASSSYLICSLDMEMMAQLAVIIVVSCVCWIPFLIHILVMQFNQSPRYSNHERDGFILLGLRMASWNQILDPWVYILLRRAVFSRVCCAFYSQKRRVTANSSYSQGFSLQ